MAADRLLEVLEEVGWASARRPVALLAAPIGQILASRALIHVLDARRYGTVIEEARALVQGGYGVRRPSRSTGAVEKAISRSRPLRPPPTSRRPRRTCARAEGLPERGGAVLIAMFGADVEELLKMIRGRHARGTVLVAEDEDGERGERDPRAGEDRPGDGSAR